MTNRDQKQTLREKRLAVQAWMMSASCKGVLAVIIVVFGTLFVLRSTTVSTKGLDISKLESQKIELERETRKIEVKIANERSLKRIQERLEGQHFVPVDNVAYVDRGEGLFARR